MKRVLALVSIVASVAASAATDCPVLSRIGSRETFSPPPAKDCLIYQDRIELVTEVDYTAEEGRTDTLRQTSRIESKLEGDIASLAATVAKEPELEEPLVTDTSPERYFAAKPGCEGQGTLMKAVFAPHMKVEMKTNEAQTLISFIDAVCGSVAASTRK